MELIVKINFDLMDSGARDRRIYGSHGLIYHIVKFHHSVHFHAHPDAFLIGGQGNGDLFCIHDG